MVALAAAPPAVMRAQQPAAPAVDLFRDLAERGLRGWMQRRVGERPTRYRVTWEDGRPVLLGESMSANSGLWRAVRVPAEDVRALAWRWRVERSLRGNRRERDKRGDDFAARVFVVFDAGRSLWSGRALCYVWAAGLPPGTVYRSPYSDDVAMIVVESGDARAGQWVAVQRDPLADYGMAFGGAPDSLTAVAVMVDTDNTGGRARAWFERLEVVRSLESTESP
jgi:hypothetical protein